MVLGIIPTKDTLCSYQPFNTPAAIARRPHLLILTNGTDGQLLFRAETVVIGSLLACTAANKNTKPQINSLYITKPTHRINSLYITNHP